jgi:hypothetical protein
MISDLEPLTLFTIRLAKRILAFVKDHTLNTCPREQLLSPMVRLDNDSYLVMINYLACDRADLIM